MISTYISEIFSSVQGEGPFTGEPQIFVRLAGCPLRCDYCDTPESLTAVGHPKKSLEQAVREAVRLAGRDKVQTVSVTGGEPLAHLSFLKEFLPRLKKAGLRVYLETAGVHPEALKAIISFVDVVAMDIKLPTATKKIFWPRHAAFLKEAQGKAFVKIILEDKSTDAEIGRAFKIVKAAKPVPVLILQPVTPRGDAQPPDASRIGKIYSRAKSMLNTVLVMPQQHKIWGVR